MPKYGRKYRIIKVFCIIQAEINKAHVEQYSVNLVYLSLQEV